MLRSCAVAGTSDTTFQFRPVLYQVCPLSRSTLNLAFTYAYGSSLRRGGSNHADMDSMEAPDPSDNLEARVMILDERALVEVAVYPGHKLAVSRCETPGGDRLSRWSSRAGSADARPANGMPMTATAALRSTVVFGAV